MYVCRGDNDDEDDDDDDDDGDDEDDDDDGDDEFKNSKSCIPTCSLPKE